MSREDFPLKDGLDPLENRSPYVAGYSLQCYTNEYGELWVAYAKKSLSSPVIWLSGVDVGWEWKMVDIKNGKYKTPWFLSPAENDWLKFLLYSYSSRREDTYAPLRSF